MFSLKSEVTVGNLSVKTTNQRGHSIEEVAERAVNKICNQLEQQGQKDLANIIRRL